MVASDDFEVEDAVFVVGIQGVGFVDDGADGGVFVEDYLADEGFVGEVGVAEVYLGCCRGGLDDLCAGECCVVVCVIYLCGQRVRKRQGHHRGVLLGG